MTGAAQLNPSLLTLSVIAVLVPAAFHSAVQRVDSLTFEQEGHRLLAVSRGASGFFFVYFKTSLLTTIH